MNTRLSGLAGRARSVLADFTAGQRTVVVVLAIALLVGVYALSRWVSAPTYTPLFGNLDGADASAVVEQLQADAVPYQLADGGATILVPQDQVYAVRVALSGKGLPANESAGGWSLLDDQGITATDFQQNVAYRRAMEGELAKTLQAMTGVNTAVVHLAIPQKDVFATEEKPTTASVLLSLAPGTRLSSDQVLSVTRLVAGSVEGLKPEQVTVTDQNGTMLSGGSDGSAAGAASAAGQADEQTAAFENRMSTAVQQMLDRVVGPNRSAVRVNAQLDFNASESTSERYVPNNPAALPQSEATVEETYTGGNGTTAAGGTLGQIVPNAANGATSGGGDYQRTQRTVNNSVNKTVEKVTTAPGQIKRMTVAVVLDAKTAAALDPAQVQQLVANSVGLDPARGDAVQVSTLPFDTTAAEQAQNQLAQAQKDAQLAGYLDLGRNALIGLVMLVLAFLVLRKRKPKPEENTGAAIEAVATDLPAPMLTPATETSKLAAAEEQLALTASRHGIDDLRDDVAALVENQPDDVAQMLQGWLAERN